MTRGTPDCCGAKNRHFCFRLLVQNAPRHAFLTFSCERTPRDPIRVVPLPGHKRVSGRPDPARPPVPSQRSGAAKLQGLSGSAYITMRGPSGKSIGPKRNQVRRAHPAGDLVGDLRTNAPLLSAYWSILDPSFGLGQCEAAGVVLTEGLSQRAALIRLLYRGKSKCCKRRRDRHTRELRAAYRREASRLQPSLPNCRLNSRQGPSGVEGIQR
jgi:hypothetical protein